MTIGTPFTIKEHDTRPTYIATLKDAFGTGGEAPINLSAASQVRFIMRLADFSGDTPAKVNAPMTITDAANGIVTYPWATGDTDTPGTYSVEFEIRWADGTVQTVPEGDYLQVVVVDDLG
jgi:hypothetical protein